MQEVKCAGQRPAQNKINKWQWTWWLSGFPGGSDSKVPACNAGDPGSIPGSGRSPGERNGDSLTYSCLENSMGRGAWWATVQGGCKELDLTGWLTLSWWLSASPPLSSSSFPASQNRPPPTPHWTYVYLRLIHIDVWQKTTKFYKAIILQLKNKKDPRPFLRSGEHTASPSCLFPG